MDRARSTLTPQDHSRDTAGLRYVYPVISRRAGGLSIGINLNTNNACNWACSYCQVPNLIRGGPEPVHLQQLESEFLGFLQDVFAGDFLSTRVPEDVRKVVDVAFSGNGEPTAAAEFPEAVDRVLRSLEAYPEASSLKKVVISNGSHVAEERVVQALKKLAAVHGELWFKLDRGTVDGRIAVNGIDLSNELIVRRLKGVSGEIPTWIQTCVFLTDGLPPSEDERLAYFALIQRALDQGADIRGLHLYSLARPAMQPGAGRLAKAPPEVLQAWAEDMPIPVRISP